jgi:hypothetical protein
MGPFGSSIASTLLWFTLYLPYFLAGSTKDYRLRTFLLTVITPVLVSIYITNQSITPYFLVPWEIMIPLAVVIYGVVMLISLINKKFRDAASGKSDNWEGRSYLMLTVFILLMLGMLAYYYTALFQFSPLGMQV